MCSEVEEAPLVELLFIYQIKGLGMQQRKGVKKGKRYRLDHEVNPNSEPVPVESHSCRLDKRNKSRMDTRKKKVQEFVTATDFILFFSWTTWALGDFPTPGTSDRLRPSTCSENHEPLRLPRARALSCPAMWTDTARRHVHHLPQCSRSFVLSQGTHKKPQNDSAGSQTAHLLYQSAGETSGTRM